MGINDYLKCPGLDRTLATIPVEIHCPQCERTIEIWSDEIKRRCLQCGILVFNPNPLVKIPEVNDAEPEQIGSQNKLDELINLAVSLGSDAVTRIPAHEISIENHLADLCQEAKCEDYGQSPTCPPNVKGPEWIKKYLMQYF